MKPDRLEGNAARWLAPLLAAGLILLLTVTAMNAAKPMKNQPNLLVILVDDLGYGDLHSYGAERLRTPNIDSIVAGGMRFDNFYANSCVCSPTRAALLTGRYPAMVGVPGVIRTDPRNSWGYLSPDAVLAPRPLKRAGYHTALIGKWHLGLESPGAPNDHGFDYFHGWLGDMMDDYYTHRRGGINFMRRNGRTIDPEGHATDLFSQWAADYVRDRAGKKRPFFLYLPYNAPHTPIQPPPDWLERVRKREPDVPERRAKLMALIEHMDHGIGQVLTALRETGQDRNTLVIFVSDNGGQVNVGARNGDVRDGKGTMYEGGIKVPAAARWPGHIEPGSRSNLIALTMDIFPTVLQAAGAEWTHEIDGVSFLPTLLGQPQPGMKRDLFFIRREGGAQFAGKTIEALRRGDWKLLQNSPFQPMELYNLREDPLEAHNLADTEPEKFRELSAALRAEIQRYGRVPWQPPAD